MHEKKYYLKLRFSCRKLSFNQQITAWQSKASWVLFILNKSFVHNCKQFTLWIVYHTPVIKTSSSLTLQIWESIKLCFVMLFLKPQTPG